MPEHVDNCRRVPNVHKSSRPLGQTLLKHPHQEERIADHIAVPQPFGLYEEPRQPLEAIVGEEARSPAKLARDVVEHGATGEGDASIYPLPVLHKPALLERHAEANEEYVGP